MIRTLALFCGGPALYEGGVPKPLLPVRERTLLHWYLQGIEPSRVRSIHLLCDESYATAFEDVTNSVAQLDVRVVPVNDGATTLERAKSFLRLSLGVEEPVCLSYPDVFTEIGVPGEVSADYGVHVSVAPLSSRFPRLFVDPYGGRVRGLSDYTSPVPANPIHIFGGHVLALAGALERLVCEFEAASEEERPSLEVDFFRWLVNRGLVGAFPLYGRWFHVDSPRDVVRLEGLLGG